LQTYHLKFPNNLGIEPKAFTLSGWKPPTTDHHSTDAPSSNFSAFNTALNTIRWRSSPKNPSLVQSNARINRWDDGSLTLQFASHPLDQYELVPKSLTMPQVNPNTPTPTQVILPNYPANHQLKYDPLMDSHTYLAAPHEHATLIRHTNQITTSLTINSEEQQDDAVQRLQESMVALKKGSKKNADGGLEVISITEDPELAKKRAELAEKEKNSAQRKLQAQQEKAEGRANNVLRRSGLRPGMSGLTVGGLEDDDGMGMTKGRSSKPKAKRARRRNSEYSDEDEELGRGRTREDEYDEDDGFLVGSDEEVEVEEDEDDEEEEDIDMDAEGEDDEEVVVKEREKQKEKETSKKVEVPAPTSGGRSKKRVIDDDEDE
jgi:RNA polymerase-associated protein LEO1